MSLRLLPQNLINKIAAGEVIERPSAVIKELLENSIDAKASNISILIREGGQKLISVSDNGSGMTPSEISLAVERHATSKLPDDNLVDIKYFGFRGEALPAIGAVSNLQIVSRTKENDSGWKIDVNGGKISLPVPSSAVQGTTVKVSNLFFATPARLKFLKSPKSEQNRIIEIFKRICIAHPEISFKLSNENKELFNVPSLSISSEDIRLQRISAILGTSFFHNTIPVIANREGFQLTGYAGLPTFNRGNSSMQYLFVNSRPVNDRILFGALKGAYQDFLASNRYAIAVLFLSAPPNMVDVNVHPTKTEVRFQNQGIVRGLIVSGVKHALSQAGHKTSTTVTDAALGAIRVASNLPNFGKPSENIPSPSSGSGPFFKNTPHGLNEGTQLLPMLDFSPSGPKAPNDPNAAPEEDQFFPLGAARCQLHETYIVAQSNNGIVIVDQHAAHERLVEERIKRDLIQGSLKSQGLLIPEIVDLTVEDCDRLLSRKEEFKELGLIIDRFGPSSLVVRETPALLGTINLAGLMQDLADDLSSYDETLTLKDKINNVSATMACHSSIRAGRRLNPDEMNSLLREMEETPYSGQCSHGRPTYIEIKLRDIERLFGRR